MFDIINATETVCADFSQGGVVRFEQNAGKQCVAMSLTAIVYSQIQDVSSWNSAILNTILMHGNSLYTCITNSVNKDLLLLTDVPAMVSVDEAIYIYYSESETGDVFVIPNDEPYYTLQSSLSKIATIKSNNCWYTALLILFTRKTQQLQLETILNFTHHPLRDFAPTFYWKLKTWLLYFHPSQLVTLNLQLIVSSKHSAENAI